jgi:hypothetical protein
MAEQEEVVHLKARIARLEAELSFYKGLHAGCEHNTNPPILFEQVVAPRNFPSPSVSTVQLSPEFPQTSFIKYVHKTPTLRNEQSGRTVSSLSRQKRPQQPKWKAAGKKFVEGVKDIEFDPDILGRTDDDTSELEGSAYDRGTKIARSTANVLRNAARANNVARIQLFYFLSTLEVLRQLEKLQEEQVEDLMNKLESNSNSSFHRKRIRDGATWFHREVISRLCNKGWGLGHAIAIVALSRSSFPSWM